MTDREQQRRAEQSTRDLAANEIVRRYGLTRACYTVTETLQLLSISRSTLYELVKGGDLKIVKLGRKSLIMSDDIAGFLDRLAEPKAAA